MGAHPHTVVTAIITSGLGFVSVDVAMRKRISQSVSVIGEAERYYQAFDDVYGLSWLVAYNTPPLMRLVGGRNDGVEWVRCSPSMAVAVNDVDNPNNPPAIVRVVGFHDTRHDAPPATLIRVGADYIYRNRSGSFVILDAALVEKILEDNKIRL